MLIVNTLDGEINKVDIAIQRLKEFEPGEGYYGAFSGGKDSIVIKKLVKMSGVKCDWHYNLTTIDPPELVRFIRKYHQDVKVDYPEKPFLIRMVEKGMPPRRNVRWCCAEYKERGGINRFVILGVRWVESNKRNKRKLVENCYKNNNKKYINPIIDWTDQDVWDFIKKYNVSYCKLYDEGWKRIGCLFCPMARKQRQIELKLYPKYREAFRKAFHKMYDNLVKEKIENIKWKNGDDYFKWWLTNDPIKIIPDQTIMFE
ncbi:MAG: phosphoadenosine phosphosulfate reductase family protein [Planctomycetia bacterium]|nr:phosphoadenosine phosphosulfate reductase family protein [Planctomycetia bacterium]